jgi:hypothetical protein
MSRFRLDWRARRPHHAAGVQKEIEMARGMMRIGMSCAALVVLGAPLGARAHDEAEGAPESRISGILQLDLSNAYYFRGILQERDGVVAQPWAELYLSLFQSETGPIRDITVGAGVWASVHDENTLATHSPAPWYETDVYPLISLGLPGGISLTTIYYFYTSPNGAFSTEQELNFKLAWDDSETLGRFALAPWVNFAIETHRTALGDRAGEGVQLGISPTLFTLENDCFPLEVALPVELGLSIDDYYEKVDGSNNEGFGYLSWALAARLPLSFVPASYGSWAFTATGKGYYFGDSLADVNEFEHLQSQGIASLSLEF